MLLWKYHGLGNDYLVLDQPAVDGPLPSRLTRALCERHRGPGADGVLQPCPGNGLRIWNPDGSEAERSGNGLRIFAKWLSEHRGAGDEPSVMLAGESRACRVRGAEVEVDMGRPVFEPAGVPVLGGSPAVVEEPIEVEGAALRFTAVGIGNPHCVVFTGEPELDRLPWRAWGAALEHHPRFPRRANVQLARIAGPARIELRVWERGAGPTASSGSSACAVVAAAVRTGRAAPGRFEVLMPGGSLFVELRPGEPLRLRGPVEEVGSFRPACSWLASRGVALD